MRTPSDVIAILRNPLASRRAILAVDYGVVNVGFAWCRSLRGIATALPPFRQPIRRGGWDVPSPALLEHFHSLVLRHAVGGIVLGWPLGPSGQLTPECARVSLLADRLQSYRVFVPTTMWDERNTTSRARSLLRSDSRLRDGEFRRRTSRLAPEREIMIDSLAARLILQDFLDFAATDNAHAHAAVLDKRNTDRL